MYLSVEHLGSNGKLAGEGRLDCCEVWGETGGLVGPTGFFRVIFLFLVRLTLTEVPLRGIMC